VLAGGSDSPASSTVRGYAAHVRLYLQPHLGPILLAELTTAHVQAMFTAIIRQHQATGHPVTAATLARIRATLRAALNTAIRHGLITGNPARHVELPPARRPHAVVWTANRVEHWHATGERPPVAVWTAAQTAQFLHAIRGDRLYAAFHLIALRGLRRGEAAGLRWCDVDLDDGVAVITQQLQQYDGHMITCPPKTSHSARVIALDHTTVAALRRHRARQQAEQHQPGHHDSGYVFTGLGGDPLAPDRLTRHFRALATAAGSPRGSGPPPSRSARPGGTCATCSTAAMSWPPTRRRTGRTSREHVLNCPAWSIPDSSTASRPTSPTAGRRADRPRRRRGLAVLTVLVTAGPSALVMRCPRFDDAHSTSVHHRRERSCCATAQRSPVSMLVGV